ncbi:calpain-12 [Microtus ochrogaster]|uniref:Calpain-12 n=1 Tax=Microtus ochrogaster TaxID=79684 RepID=A0ABM0LRI5_MICOH|nr:calpain-12 [Microtus ochrogaster]
MESGDRKVTIQLVEDGAEAGARGPQLFKGQNYEAIRTACLESGILFRDPYFSAGPDALGYDKLGPDSEKAKGVEWKRPYEFCAEPHFICEDMSRTDVCQGSLGNCWLLAAAASLTLYPRLLYRVVPPGQSFQDGYAGVFHFQLWQFGRWVDVVVDDRLPVREGKLMFVRSEQRNEFWAPLLEKAYAKLHGSYEVMRGGHMNEAFVDFTGGVGEVLYLRRNTPGLFAALRHALAKESLVGATALVRAEPPNGPPLDHHNPRCCPRWDMLPSEWRDALLVKKEDGEFWMELQDFLTHFNTVQICSLSPEVLGPSPAGGGWHIHIFQGRWVRGFNSGGSQPSAETFWTNPQFRLTLLEPDEEEDEDDEEGPWGGWGAAGARGPARGGRMPKCTVLLSLIQRNRRCLRARGLTYLTVGFHVFQIPEELLGLWDSPRSRALLPGLLRADRSVFCARRDVSRRCRLPPGHYLVVPSASRVGDEADFTLRIFSERSHTAVEIDDVISADLDALQVPYKPLELELAQLFLELAGEEEELDALQLQTLISIALEPARANARTSGEIGLRTCEQLVQCFGHGRRLALHHFQELWGHLLVWQATFDKFDEDASGTMNSYELRLALNAAGFHLNNQLTQSLTSRYRDSRLRVDFERFVSCAARLTCIFRHCSQHLDGGEGVVCLTHKQWSEVATFS